MQKQLLKELRVIEQIEKMASCAQGQIQNILFWRILLIKIFIKCELISKGGI